MKFLKKHKNYNVACESKKTILSFPCTGNILRLTKIQLQRRKIDGIISQCNCRMQLIKKQNKHRQTPLWKIKMSRSNHLTSMYPGMEN